jgi:dihydroorotate dehydrogenase (fumarate)
MVNLKTRYMGLELKNPVIAGASELVTDPENLKRIEKSGAAAIVYKSLFEEQIQLENLELYERKTEYEERHAEMISLFPNSKSDNAYPVQHLQNLRKAKETVSIPVIASLNAITDETWVDYAKEIEKTGVDALELNFYTAPEKADGNFSDIEKKQTETLKKVKSVVNIPVSVKLSPFYTNPLKFISDLENAGADAFVLFNRLFQPDIDTETEEHQFPYSLSHVEDNRLPLRFAGLLHGKTKSSVCASSGIFSGSDVVKMILAGADCVQVVSALYLSQIEVLESIIGNLEKWMEGKGYTDLESFRGKLSVMNSKDKVPYHRSQYIDFKLSTSAILRKYRASN